MGSEDRAAGVGSNYEGHSTLEDIGRVDSRNVAEACNTRVEEGSWTEGRQLHWGEAGRGRTGVDIEELLEFLARLQLVGEDKDCLLYTSPSPRDS